MSSQEESAPSSQERGYTAEQEELAKEKVHDPQFAGVDGEGDVHFYSLALPKVVVVDPVNQTAEMFNLREIPPQTLGEWARHVEQKRGEWRESRIGFKSLAERMRLPSEE